MTSEQYRRWSAPFRTPGRTRGVIAVNQGLTLLCFAAYPLCLGLLWLGRDPRLWQCVTVPGTGFWAVTLFRRLYNAPRPYEALDIQPLKTKDKRGQSFPSRHVFSVTIIAMTLLWLRPPLGWVFLVLSAVLAWCRVILGVHFPRDVAAGAAAGLLWGAAGYFLLPLFW